MTGPRIPSPEEWEARQGTTPLSPQEWERRQQTLRRTLQPLRTPMVPREATATGLDATVPGLELQARARTLPGQLEAAPGQVAEIAGQALRHPLQTAAGMARAVVEAPYLTGRYAAQQLQKATFPASAIREDVTGKEALAGAAMLASPLTTAAVGPLAASALTGAAFMPDQPIAGGIIGAALHTAARGRFRQRAQPEAPLPPEPQPFERGLPSGPSPIRATMAPEARTRPVEPDYTVRTNEPAPEVPVHSLTVPQAPKLLPRPMRVAPEEPAAPAAPAAAAPKPAVPSPLKTLTRPVEPERPTSWLPEDAPEAPKVAPIRARTASGALMSPRKATDTQIFGEFRALTDAQSVDGAFVESIESHPALLAYQEMLSGAVAKKGGSMREDARGLLEEAGFTSDDIKQYFLAKKQVENRAKSLAKVEAEITRRKIDLADAYWMAGGEEAAGQVGEQRPAYGGVTPEQRAKFDALYGKVRPVPAAERMLAVGKQRAAELDKPAGPPDLAPALEREGTVGERKHPYLKTAPSLFAPDNPSMFEGPANMDETSVGKRPDVPTAIDTPKVRNAAEMTAGEDQGKLFERGKAYGKNEKLTGVAFRAKDGGKVYSMEGFDGGHSELFDQLESDGVPTVDVPGEGRFERAFATFDHGFITSSGRFVTREEGLAIARRQHQVNKEDRVTDFGLAAENIKGAKVSEQQAAYGTDARVKEAPARYALQAAGDQGFPSRLYSRVARAIDSSPFQKGTADQWKAHLSKNVPASEREYSGLDAFLAEHKTGTLTRQQVAEAFNAGRIRLTETTLGGGDISQIAELRRTTTAEVRALLDAHEVTNAGDITLGIISDIEHYPNLSVAQLMHDHSLPRDPEIIATLEHWRRSSVNEGAKVQPVRFKNWSEPGGENYREHILSLEVPGRGASLAEKNATHNELDQALYRAGITDHRRVALLRHELNVLPREKPAVDVLHEHGIPVTEDVGNAVIRYRNAHNLNEPGPFASTHWPGISNPLVHVRTADHVLPSGEKALLIEEIQSDWHQKGRKEGYGREKIEVRQVNRSDLAPEERTGNFVGHEGPLYASFGEDGRRLYVATTEGQARSGAETRLRYRVPEAPLKKTEQWAELGLKKAIDEAVQGGYERIVWVNGETQAARYDLSKHVDALRYDPKTERLTATKGDKVIHEGTYDARALADVIGKDYAEKLLAQPVIQPEAEIATLESKRGRVEEDLKRHRASHPEDKAVHDRMMEVRDAALAVVEKYDRLGFDDMSQAMGAIRAHGDWVQRWGDGMTDAEVQLVLRYRAASQEQRDMEAIRLGREEPYLEDMRKITVRLGELRRAGGTHELTGQSLKVGGAGMKAFYDKMLPNIARDYAKTLGVKLEIEPVKMGKAEKGVPADVIYLEGENMAERGRFVDRANVLGDLAARMESTGETWREALDVIESEGNHATWETQGASEWLERYEKDNGYRSSKTFQSFKVTPELRAAVAGGQRLAEPRANYDQLDAFTPQQLDAFSKPTPAAIEARQKRVYGSVERAQRAIQSVTKHAGKFATQYPERSPTPAGRLKSIAGRDVKGSLVHLVGQALVAPAEIAQALYPFRSPLTERFFTIAYAGDGTIASATIDTSGATNYVAPFGGDIERFAADIAARARRVNSREVDIAHNHPSGDPTPSRDDLAFMSYLGSLLETKHGVRLRGQLIIDHRKATWMYPEKTDSGFGIAQRHVDVAGKGEDWTKEEGRRVSGPEDVVKIVGPAGGNGGLHVVYFDGQMRVLALEAHNPSALRTIGTWLPAHAKGFGSGSVVLVGPKGTSVAMVNAVNGAKMVNISVRDIMTVTPGVVGRPSFTSENASGTILGEPVSRSDQAERQAFRRLSEPDAPYAGAGGLPRLAQPGAIREQGAGYGRSDGYKKARAAGIASGLTPEQADAYAAAAKDIDFDGAKAVALAKEQAGGLRTRLRRWADAAADQTRAIDRLSRVAVERGMPMDKAPEYELALSYNSDDTIRRALYDAPEMATTHGILDPINREPMGPTLESVVKPLGHDPEKVRQAFTYVVALRKVGRGLRATAGDANELQAALDAVDALGKIPRNRQFAMALQSHLDGIGRYAVRSGLWTEQQWEQLKHSDLFYIPFQRLMTHIEAAPGTKTYGTKRANLSAGIERFEGSRRFLMNPVEAVAGYDSRIIRRADAYRVGSSVIDALTQYMGEEGAAILTPLAANDPAVKAFTAAAMRRNLAQSGLNVAEVGMVADLSAPQIDPHNPVIWRHRKGGLPPKPKAQGDVFSEEMEEQPTDREYFLLNEPELYKALVATRADSPLGTGALMTAFRVARRIMTVTTTGINPRFALGLNIARDVPQAIMQNEGMRPDDIAAGALEAMKTVVGQSDFADLMARHGLGNASIYAHAINAEAAARRLAPVTKLQRLTSKAGAAVKWPLEFAERIGAASDLVARLAAARAVRRNAIKAGETPRAGAARAATAGIRATVNFNRRAGTPLMQFLEQSVPFFGAAIRSVVRFGEAGTEVPLRVTGALVVVTLAVMAEWAMTKRDKEKRAQQVDRLPSERSRFVQFGGYRWPLSQEMALAAAGVRTALAQFTKDDPDNAEQLMQAIYNLMPPVVSDLAQGDVIAPWPGWREAQEISRNRQSYGDRPIVPERLMGKPPALRRLETTSPTFDVLAQGARKGAVIIPALAEASPLGVEHVVRGFFNNMTPLITALSDAALRRTALGRSLNVPIPLPISQAPLSPTSAFVVREPPGRTASEAWFYARRREFEQGRSGEKDVTRMERLAETPAGVARAEGVRARAGAGPWSLEAERALDVQVVFKEATNVLEQYQNSVTEIRQQVNDGTLSAKGARLLLDNLAVERQRMLRVTRAALEQMGVPSQYRAR